MMRARIPSEAIAMLILCCLTLVAKVALSLDAETNAESSAKLTYGIVGNWECGSFRVSFDQDCFEAWKDCTCELWR